MPGGEQCTSIGRLASLKKESGLVGKLCTVEGTYTYREDIFLEERRVCGSLHLVETLWDKLEHIHRFLLCGSSAWNLDTFPQSAAFTHARAVSKLSSRNTFNEGQRYMNNQYQPPTGPPQPQVL